jgi:hypothetical protein
VSENEVNGENEGVDPGEPVAALVELSVEPSSGFLDRVRRAIGRRRFAGQVADLLWNGPIVAAVEFLGMLFGAFSGSGEEGESRGDGQHR